MYHPPIAPVMPSLPVHSTSAHVVFVGSMRQCRRALSACPRVRSTCRGWPTGGSTERSCPPAPVPKGCGWRRPRAASGYMGSWFVFRVTVSCMYLFIAHVSTLLPVHPLPHLSS
ncbi:uncharacterized protein B0H18DRAFT_26010 [Fomitopsis serialis]|uniref:uncharacterized protein n=1 Tax=Fomitopsis serialis TaxID=139415 RepID=UPI0020089ECD|nr:uncharacterized protein B0H18DRAFT_26010 [Neoantrodia serialis]KAH9932470.1 hypothetical protein B0H18DRAFT_26010 [Neoantrodia serialis]